MILMLESGKVIENPTDAAIEVLLPTEHFAILTDGPDSYTYIQFAESKDEPWVLLLEYQIASLDNHYRAVNSPLTMEQIIAAFQQYARGDDSWKTDFTWERMRL